MKNLDPKKIRQIIIETDGNNILLKKAEVSGSIELMAILEAIILQFKENNAKQV